MHPPSSPADPIAPGIPASEPAAAWTCPSCGAASPGEFCPACGERRLDARDRSVRGFLAEAFRSVTSLDSSLLRSLRLLLSRPGALTAEHATGRRRGYVPPLQLFLLCNLVFFAALALTRFNAFTTPLDVHMTALPHADLATRLVEAEVARRATTLAEYRVAFDRAIATQAKTLVVVMVPMFALMVQLVNVRRRTYFVDSLTFALHFFAWLVLVMTAQGLVLLGAVVWSRTTGGSAAWVLTDRANSAFLAAVMWAYLSIALRAAFGGGRPAAVLRALLLTVSVLGVVHAYRLVLFVTTFLSV